MTYPFKFQAIPPPSLTLGRSCRWGALSATEVRVTPGRYPGQASPDHRVLFYLTPGITTDCACEGLVSRRTQSAFEFDVVPAGAGGVWEDHGACELVSVALGPALVDATAEALGIGEGHRQLAPRLGARDPRMEHVLRGLVAELSAPTPAGRLYADSLATALTARLLQSSCAGRAPTRQTLSKPQVRRIVDYVEAHLDSDLRLEQLAEVAGISVPHLTSLFRRTMGQSVHGYVMSRRVERARTLLLSGDLSIAEVALESGFAHQSHMARWIRRLLGVTPSALRR